MEDITKLYKIVRRSFSLAHLKLNNNCRKYNAKTNFIDFT